MATTLSNFVVVETASLKGTGTKAAPYVVACEPNVADALTGFGPGGTATSHFLVDRQRKANLATAGYAKNGASVTSLTGTTPVTLSLIDLTSNSTDSAGDTVFATWNTLIIYNLGAADITIKQAGSNPASLLGISTTPAQTIPAGSKLVLQSAAGVTVDSTHKDFVITPTSGGSVAVAVGGA